MDYHMAFDPDLGLNARDFVAAWNDTPECRALAEAQLIPHPPLGFPLDPQHLQQGLVLLTGAAGAAGALAIDALKDVVKDKLTTYLGKKLSRKPSITVMIRALHCLKASTTSCSPWTWTDAVS